MEKPINKQSILEIKNLSSKYNIRPEEVLEDFIYVESTLHYHLVEKTCSVRTEDKGLIESSFRIMNDFYSRNEHPLEKVASKETIVSQYENFLLQQN